MSNLRRVGQAAEDRAAEFLMGLGYTLVTRRYKARHGEIDLVALDGDTLVFVEVKHRSAPGYRPEEAMGEQKIAALHRAVEEYRARMGEGEREWRLDFVAIDAEGLRHYPDAFRD